MSKQFCNFCQINESQYLKKCNQCKKEYKLCLLCNMSDCYKICKKCVYETYYCNCCGYKKGEFYTFCQTCIFCEMCFTFYCPHCYDKHKNYNFHNKCNDKCRNCGSNDNLKKCRECDSYLCLDYCDDIIKNNNLREELDKFNITICSEECLDSFEKEFRCSVDDCNIISLNNHTCINCMKPRICKKHQQIEGNVCALCGYYECKKCTYNLHMYIKKDGDRIIKLCKKCFLIRDLIIKSKHICKDVFDTVLEYL